MARTNNCRLPSGLSAWLTFIQSGDGIRESRREESKTLVQFIDTTANRARAQPAGQTTWSSRMASQAPHCGQRRIGVFIIFGEWAMRYF